MSDARISVRVHPRARRSGIDGFVGEVLHVRVTAPPEGGKANEALASLLGEALHIAKGRVQLVRGKSSREKVVSIEGVSREEVVRTLTQTPVIPLKKGQQEEPTELRR